MLQTTPKSPDPPCHPDARAQRHRARVRRRAARSRCHPAVVRRERPRDARLHPRRGQAGARRGQTFYTNARGITPLREAIRDFHAAPRTPTWRWSASPCPGRDAGRDRALQCVVETGDNIVVRLAGLAEHFPGGGDLRRGSAIRAARQTTGAPRLRAGGSISTSCSRPAMRARRRSSSPRPAIRPAGSCRATNRRALLDFARKRGIAIISDEVYGTILYDGRSHAPSFLADRRARRRGVRDQQLLETLGDDGLAHRLARASAIARPADVDDVRCQQHGRHDLRAMGRAGGAVAGRRRVPRRNAARAAARAKPSSQDWLATQNRIRWIETGRRVLRISPCRRIEGQPGLRTAPRAQSARRRGAGLGLQLPRTTPRGFLPAHLLRPGRQTHRHWPRAAGENSGGGLAPALLFGREAAIGAPRGSYVPSDEARFPLLLRPALSAPNQPKRPVP